MGNYVLAMTTTESDENGRPKKPGAINAGFYKKTNEDNGSSQYTFIVISVENLKNHVKLIEGAGGKVLVEPMDIPGVGLYLSFLDNEGNRLGMI